MELQKVKAVLFDLDGTLLDTVKDIGTGANIALCRYGYPEQPISVYRDYIGHGIRELLRQAVPSDISEEAFEQVVQFYLQYYPEHCTEYTDYFPGIQEAVRKLAGAGFQLAVISNKTERTCLKIIRHYFPDTGFQFVWGNNGSRPLKPALDAGRHACETLHLEPDQILFFGDGDTDMAFASQMGFAAVGCSWGYRSVDQLRAAGAQAIMNSPEELLAMLGQS